MQVHLAAASQVTGIELQLIYIRLSILPLVILFVLQLAGWGYSGERSGHNPLSPDPPSNPYPERLALNQEAFERPDLSDLRVLMEEFGVRYLVVDRVNGYPADPAALRRVAVPVYRAPDAWVFQLR